MFFVHFYDFPVHFSGWRGSGWVLGSLLGAPHGGRGAVGVPKNLKNHEKMFFFSQKLVFRLEMGNNGYLVMF